MLFEYVDIIYFACKGQKYATLKWDNLLQGHVLKNLKSEEIMLYIKLCLVESLFYAKSTRLTQCQFFISLAQNAHFISNLYIFMRKKKSITIVVYVK